MAPGGTPAPGAPRPAAKAPAPSISPARTLALKAIAHSLDHTQDLQYALDQAITQAQAKGSLPPREAALATELAYGFLRLKGRVEYVLSLFLQNPAKLHPSVYRAMGLAAHEIMHLPSIPARASAHWAVEAAKALAGPKLAGVANAVLRKVADLGEEALDPALYRRDGCKDPTFLSRYYACPEWIVQGYLDALGREGTEAVLAAQTQAPPLGLWLPPAGKEHGGPGEGGDTLPQHPDARLDALAKRPDCLQRLDRGLAFPAGTGLEELGVTPEDLTTGRVERQSLAAGQALTALGADIFSTDAPVWDCCAGRGNKTRYILGLARGPVLASDVHQGRLKALGRGLSSWPGLLTFRARADAPAPLAVKPALIVADAPCSGLGVLSRRPDGKWKRTPGDVRELARLQAAILDHAWEALAPGGRLLYLTCTINRAENQDQIGNFLARTPGAKLAGEWSTPPDSALREFFFAALVEKRPG